MSKIISCSYSSKERELVSYVTKCMPTQARLVLIILLASNLSKENLKTIQNTE